MPRRPTPELDGSSLDLVLSVESLPITMSIAGFLSRNLPDPIANIARPYYRRYARGKTKIAELADAHGIIGPNDIYSENYYEKRRKDSWRSEAHGISRGLYDEFQPNSVIDFGCAIGQYLEPFLEEGAAIHGIDGHPKALEHAVIPSECIELHDLRTPYRTTKQYDLALCFEVAEHIPRQYTDTLVNAIADSSETVVFTAAQPGQGGTHHVHLKPREYWIGKFREAGMAYQPEITNKLQESIEVDKLSYMEDDLYIFSKKPD